jgi:hypothetical protein
MPDLKTGCSIFINWIEAQASITDAYLPINNAEEPIFLHPHKREKP